MMTFAATLALGFLAADLPAMVPPADFKLVVRVQGVKAEQASTTDVVVRRGLAYEFIKNRREEILVIDPAKGNVTLIDLDRRVQTLLTVARLDKEIDRRYKTLDAVARKKSAAESSRADRIASAMTRDLIEPRFEVERDPNSPKLRLSNASVEMTVEREPEADLARSRMIANCLAADIKVGAFREPDDVPPFTRLETLRILAEEDTLRPSRWEIVYRLSGPPQKLSVRYEVVPELTDREREAIARVETLRVKLPYLAYDQFETPGEP